MNRGRVSPVSSLRLVLLHLLRTGLSVDELDQVLNKRSGLLGLHRSRRLMPRRIERRR